MVDAGDALRRGRESYLSASWASAHEALSSADQDAPLVAPDLEVLAASAYMLGRDDEHVSVLERAHHAYLDAGETLQASRCAFWMGLNLMLRGDMAPATGWLGRARRLVEGEGEDCVAQGYLLVPVAARQVMSRDGDSAYGMASEIYEIALSEATGRIPGSSGAPAMDELRKSVAALTCRLLSRRQVPTTRRPEPQVIGVAPRVGQSSTPLSG